MHVVNNSTVIMAADRGKRKRVRYTLDINFESEVAKDSFAQKLTAVRELLTPRGAPKLDNLHLLLALFDCATVPTNAASETADDDLSAPSTKTLLRNEGVFA